MDLHPPRASESDIEKGDWYGDGHWFGNKGKNEEDRCVWVLEESYNGACPFPLSLQLRELHREKVKVNYAFMQLSACWLGFLHRKHQISSPRYSVFTAGCLPLDLLCLCVGLRCKSLLTGLALASLEVMVCGRKQPGSIFLLKHQVFTGIHAKSATAKPKLAHSLRR